VEFWTEAMNESTKEAKPCLSASAKLRTDSGLEGGEAVVDLDTKVYGTENLFVVDASIHADLPTGNTQAIVMVVAERAAERILVLPC